MEGMYVEPLKSGGELVVSAKEWYIEYYFSGPDNRYNGEIIKVKSNDVNSYIDAFYNNFAKYQNLLKEIPSDGEFYCKGECNMNISISKFYKGVSISKKYYHLSKSCFPIDTQEKLDGVILDYIYCEEKAAEIKRKLFD